MARTYKRYPIDVCYRGPKGHRQAVLAGCRNRAIPPDSWDDVAFDRSVWLPQKVAKRMVLKGASYWQVVRHIKAKFSMLLRDAEWAAEVAEWSRPKETEGRLVVFKERTM